MSKGSLVLALDLTGPWQFKLEPGDAMQPHLIRVAGQFVDNHTPFVHLVWPEPTWAMDEQTEAIHGVTREAAMDDGVPLDQVMADIFEVIAEADRIVLYGVNLWQRVLDQAAVDARLNALPPIPMVDAMIAAKVAMNKATFPRFSDAYEYFTRRPYEPILTPIEGGLQKLQATLDIWCGACRALGKPA